MYVVIDIGATKTEIGFFKNKDLLSRTYTNVFATSQNYNKTMLKIINEISLNVQDIKSIQSISISFPGAVNQNGEILQASNIPEYKNKPLVKTLEDVFSTKVLIIQDSSCSAIAQLLYSQIEGYTKIVHLILGTGLGGSLIEITPVQKVPIKVDQTTITPFEPWGMILSSKSARVHTMNNTKGILEAYVGGGSVESFYNVKLAAVDDNHKIWKEISEYMVFGLNNINTVLKPELIILDGGIIRKRKKAVKSIISEFKKLNQFLKPAEVRFTDLNFNTSLMGALAVNFVDHLIINI